MSQHTVNAQFKNIKSYLSKNIPLESLYLVTMSNLTHLQDRNKKVKFMSRILEKIHVGSETNGKVGSGSEKIIPESDPQHCLALLRDFV